MRSNIIRILPAIALTLALSASPGTAPAQSMERIAAVVNDEVISMSDVTARLDLALLSSGLDASEANQRRLMPQVLRALVDETLQRQETSRLNIAVPEEAVNEAMATIARNNGMAPDQLQSVLAAAGVPASTLHEQISATLAWRELIERRVAPQVEVGEDEIDAVAERIAANRGMAEYLIADIFLAVDHPSQEQEIRLLAEQLEGEIRAGAPIQAVAQQFSQSASAAVGGDLGWVMEGQLEPALDSAISNLQVGQLSPPIRTIGGFHLVFLRDRRRMAMPSADQVSVLLARLVFPFGANPTQSEADRLVAQANEVASTLQGCEALRQEAAERGVQDMVEAGEGRMNQLAPGLRAVVEDLPDGQPSEPQVTPDGVILFMICSRTEEGSNPLDRDAIERNLGSERIDMLQRRYLRDLRNAAYIELRV